MKQNSWFWEIFVVSMESHVDVFGFMHRPKMPWRFSSTLVGITRGTMALQLSTQRNNWELHQRTNHRLLKHSRCGQDWRVSGNVLQWNELIPVKKNTWGLNDPTKKSSGLFELHVTQQNSWCPQKLQPHLLWSSLRRILPELQVSWARMAAVALLKTQLLPPFPPRRHFFHCLQQHEIKEQDLFSDTAGDKHFCTRPRSAS